MKNRRLAFALLARQPAPTIVPFLIEAIDRCDPTRSRELKPSVRMRHRADSVRVVKALVWCGFAAVSLLAIVAYFN